MRGVTAMALISIVIFVAIMFAIEYFENDANYSSWNWSNIALFTLVLIVTVLLCFAVCTNSNNQTPTSRDGFKEETGSCMDARSRNCGISKCTHCSFQFQPCHCGSYSPCSRSCCSIDA